MIAGLFAVQLILAMLTIFTTYMISNKFKNIEASLDVYGSSRVYKTQADIDFIEKVLMRYKEGIENIGEEVDLESIIRAVLYKEYIGKFPFLSIKNIAAKVTRLMWGMIVIEGVVAATDKSINAAPTIIMITTSILITILIEMFKFIKGIEEEKDTIIALVQDYIVNIYPAERRKKLKNKQMLSKEIINIRTTVSELEKEIEIEEELEALSTETQQQGKISNDELSMQDIAKLIGILH